MLKKIAACLLTAALLFAAPSAQAAEAPIGLLINGQAVTPAEPVLMLQEHVYVPMRYIGEYLGAQVEYTAADESDAAHVIMTKQFDGEILERVRLYYGRHEQETTYTIDHKSTTLQKIAPQTMTLIKGVSYVPLRTAAEALHAQVDWRADERLVVITEQSVDKAALLAEIKWAESSGNLEQDADTLQDALEEAKAQAQDLKVQIEALENNALVTELTDKKATGELDAKKRELQADKEKLAYWKQEIERLQGLLP